ncbi:hypothetical protein [Sphingobacterium sp. JB170]|uniref:hypothetical protein n=1 Tax=Sphingobacterium sp. JB170 TaxID=1434842 RepID=UPI00097EB7D3|nr:hypothetical protein [Sphingobacterium sp. JB170]SJN49854.1 hypothetical protein FM107_19350 [Sphingobacterium sp. JB170]
MILKSPFNYKTLLCFVGASFVFFTSCSKGSVVPNVGEDDTLANEYEIESLVYFLSDSDKIDTVKVNFDAEEFNNSSNTLKTVQQVETFNDLVKTSVFQLDKTGDELPHDLDIAQFEVNVPGVYYPDGTFSFYSERFSLSDTLVKEPYNYNNSFTLDLKVPANSKLIVKKSIDQHNMVCSFELVFRNKTTGEIITLNGKWRGVLRYFNEHFRVEEKTWDRF